MSWLRLSVVLRTFALMALSFLVTSAFGQILPANQGSNISGPEELCAEQKGEYKFKHPTKDCQCDNIQWSVSNGSFDPAPTTSPAPFNDKAKIKWDKGKNTGTVSLVATKCYKNLDENGEPIYDAEWNENETYTVHIFDAGMVDLFVSGQSSLSCSTEEITLMLDVRSIHLSPSQLQNIQWTVPAVWTIKPPQEVAGTYYGQGFPNVVVLTNGQATGSYTISVTYAAPEFCPAKTYDRSVTFNIGSCKELISYPEPPNFHQSHSAVATDFVFTQPAGMSSGSNYTFVSGEEINLETNFEVIADAETTFEAFIAPCGCNSPWHDPDEMGKTSIDFDGNFSEKSAVVRERESVSSKRPSQELIGNEPRLYIYPNPSNGNVWVEAEGLRGYQKIMLHNIDGRKVWERDLDFNIDESFSIDITDRIKGLYIITVTNSLEGTYLIEKLILQ